MVGWEDGLRVGDKDGLRVGDKDGLVVGDRVDGRKVGAAVVG